MYGGPLFFFFLISAHHLFPLSSGCRTCGKLLLLYSRSCEIQMGFVSLGSRSVVAYVGPIRANKTQINCGKGGVECRLEMLVIIPTTLRGEWGKKLLE